MLAWSHRALALLRFRPRNPLRNYRRFESGICSYPPPPLPSPRTLVTKSFSFSGHRFFFQLRRTCLMAAPVIGSRKLPFLLRAAVVFLCGLAIATALLADTPGLLRRANPAACYCGCSQSQGRAGCIKMCDRPRHASRWSATSCAKPRIKTPGENPGAGPRFPRSDRAERASR